MNNDIKNWDITKIVDAVITDDPQAEQIRESLTQALTEVQQGKFARTTELTLPQIVETRHKSGLSQGKFAERLGISVNTLRSWEQGQRNPSGAAAVLLKLLNKRPELMVELG